MSQTKAQLLDNIKDNVQLDARNALRFADTDSSHYVAFKAPATVSSNVTWTLPAADGSANYVLATDGSGTLSWIADPAGQWVTSGSNIYFTGGNVGIGDSSPSNPLSVTGASAFNGDVTFTGASYNILWDKSIDALKFADNAKLMIGAGDDFYITSGGTGVKLHANTGTFELEGDSVQIWNAAQNEAMAKFTANGEVQLYYDNVEKLNTGSHGVTVHGQLYSTGTVTVPDNGYFKCGAGDDLQLDHNGSDSTILNQTGNLRVRNAGEFQVTKSSTENMLIAKPDGSVELYYDNAKKFETDASGATLTGRLKLNDNYKVSMGDDADFQIYHDGSNSYIKDAGTGILSVNTNQFQLTNAADTEVLINAVENGNVALYYDNSKKFETTNTGVSITTNAAFPDNGKAIFGASDDILLYHDGTNSYLTNNTGDLYLRCVGSGDDIYIVSVDNISLSPGNENGVNVQHEGPVELYYNNVKTFETTSTGAKVISAGSSHGLYVFHSNGNEVARLAHNGSGDEGTLVLKDSGTATISLNGENGQDCNITTGGNFDFEHDSAKLRLGAGNDLQIYHDGTNSYIWNKGANAGNFYIQGAGADVDKWLIIQAKSGEDSIVCKRDAEVLLAYDGSKKFETTSTGSQFTGRWVASGGSSIITQSCYLSAGSNNATQIGMFNGYGAKQGFCFYNNGSGAYNSWGFISDGTNVSLKSAAYNIGNETDLSTNWTERFRWTTGGAYSTSNGYTGGFTTSSGTSPTGLYMGHVGTTNQQVSCNSYGYECNVINNISGAGHLAGVHQYRTLNSVEGTLQGDSSGLSISNNSDYRKKERITDLTGSLEVIDSLRPRQYYYRAGFGKPTRAHAGFIAHELQSTDLPQLTTGVKDAVVTQEDKDNGLYNMDNVGDPIYQTVAYSNNELITRLVGAVKELKAKVEALEGA